jgi:hypothetical protein
VLSDLFLWDTHCLLSFDDGLGLTEFFPLVHRLDPVGLEEFHQTPPMIGTGCWRLVTNWARHLDIYLEGTFNPCSS